MCADASPQGLPDARRRGRFFRKIYKVGERRRRLAGQELSQTHGETLPRIKGNMTFEKNVRVCLFCGGARGGDVGSSRAWVWVWVEVSTLPFSPPLPTSLCPKVGRGSQGVPRFPSPCVSPSFISEMKLEGKCNLRRPTKGGRGESNQATSPLGL